MTRIIIPQLDANLVDVTITAWRKSVGESIIQGETIAELTTDKAVYELEAPADGELLAVIADVKSVVPTGYIVGLIGTSGEEDPDIEADNENCMAAYRGESANSPSTSKRERKERIRATPKARRLAKKNGLDLAEIKEKTGVEVVDEAAIKQFMKL
ncbi:MAG: E3 binding domain-containing protein [Kiritimatiellae bacterium]|jgi:pyruvate/2-oxoglutarate dehydrogenase complex dihydrolipoamide acyltransferase (E2) component|nr:E3 binding domain-containing protein [Kiritimatiellia bacterium]